MNAGMMASPRVGAATIIWAVVLAAFATVVQADPPSRAARLGYLQGSVSFSPAGDDEWVQASLNRPMTVGDRLWVDNDARAEIQLGGSQVRMAERTSVALLNFDDRFTQLQLSQGRLNVRVRALRSGESMEVATPNLAFTIDRPGDYRIDVDPQADATTITLRNGAGAVYGQGSAYTLRSGDVARFYGTDLRDQEFYSLGPSDAFDRWASERDRRWERSASARYVAPEVVGYADLDQYGTWRPVTGYGNVWYPRDTPRDWAPYRYGHWAWVDPWGWTWVDDAPWGFAPFHYGRWATIDGRWGWVPGPVNVRPVYAPALVAFIGGDNFRLSIATGPAAGIGWFPLAPGEAYRPAYVASRDYVRNVNVSNTVINTTVINNIYNQTNVTQVNYRNAQVENAVTAVPAAVFAQSRNVQRAAVPVARDVVGRGRVTPVAAVAPAAASMMGGAPATDRRPPRDVEQRAVLARAAPAAPMAPPAQRAEVLQRDPGKPLERAAIVAKPGNVPPGAPNVNVVESAKTPPIALPSERRIERAGRDTPPPRAANGSRPATTAAPAPSAERGQDARRNDAVGAPVPTSPADAQRGDSRSAQKGPPPREGQPVVRSREQVAPPATAMPSEGRGAPAAPPSAASVNPPPQASRAEPPPPQSARSAAPPPETRQRPPQSTPPGQRDDTTRPQPPQPQAAPSQAAPTPPAATGAAPGMPRPAPAPQARAPSQQPVPVPGPQAVPTQRVTPTSSQQPPRAAPSPPQQPVPPAAQQAQRAAPAVAPAAPPNDKGQSIQRSRDGRGDADKPNAQDKSKSKDKD